MVGPADAAAGGTPPDDPQSPPDTREPDSQHAGPRDEARPQDSDPRDSDPRDSDPQDRGDDPQDRDSDPQDGGDDPQDGGERKSALRAAAENTAFRHASRNVWPGTENRHPDPAPARPAPADPRVSSFGPLGAALPNAGQAGRSAPTDEQIWEPRRLYKKPLLRPRRSSEGSPGGPSRQGTGPQPPEPRRPERPGPEHGTGPRDVRSGKTAAPEQEGPAPQGPARQGPVHQDPVSQGPVYQGPVSQRPRRQALPPEHHDIPVRRLAITAGSGSGSPDAQRPQRPDGSGRPAPTVERMAERLQLGDLMADSRMRIWKRRLLVAIVAGLVFTFIFTWRAGLTAAVLAAIADAIYRSRTTASMPPGVKLTGAQKHTQRQLARMERSGYRALHSRPIPGSREFIDHFVVGPTGAYAIDSESWDKRLPIRTRNARQLYHGPFSKKDRLEHARWEAQQASDRLTSELRKPVYVRPVLAVYGPKVPWIVATIREVDVFSGDRLRKYLRRNAAMRDRPTLSASEVEEVYTAAARVLPLNNAAQRTPVG